MSNKYSRERMENMGAPALPPVFQAPQGGPMENIPPLMPDMDEMQIPPTIPQMQIPMDMQLPYMMHYQMPICPPMQDMMYNPFMSYPSQDMQTQDDDDNMVSQRFRRRRDFDHFRFRPFFPFRPFFFDFDHFFPFFFFDFFSPFRRF